ncbi:MAG: cell division protein FtsQ/DivIB [Patescibacteria group bacterium]|nr:cell division protein FtsQ/DivIB [Patescibacteria group bacterium]
MRKRDYSEHHSHATVTHEVVLRKPKKRRPFFLRPFFWILIILIGLLGTAVFSPVLAIKKITITGTNNTEIIGQVEGGAKNFLARQKIANFFILAKNNLKKELSGSEKIEEIKISCKFPNTLIIEVIPKVPAFVWQEGDKYFLVDNEGKVTTPIILAQNEWNLPLVSDATTTVFTLQNQLVKKEVVNFIKEFNQEFNKMKSNIVLANYIIPDLNGQEVDMVTKEGWKIILLSGNNVNKVIENLKFLLSTKFKDQKPKEYLDLRLEERIFYK